MNKKFVVERFFYYINLILFLPFRSRSPLITNFTRYWSIVVHDNFLSTITFASIIVKKKEVNRIALSSSLRKYHNELSLKKCRSKKLRGAKERRKAKKSEVNIPKWTEAVVYFVSLIYLSPVHRLVVPGRILAAFQSLAAGIGPARKGSFHLFLSVWYPAARAGASSRLALDLWQGDCGGADRETAGGGGRGRAFHAAASTR